ncbi:MAG: hypothetical protein M3619_24990 [Myxococcota bacterium]|nr:hypothetical protein [Myxococcota bacterium]
MAMTANNRVIVAVLVSICIAGPLGYWEAKSTTDQAREFEREDAKARLDSELERCARYQESQSGMITCLSAAEDLAAARGCVEKHIEGYAISPDGLILIEDPTDTNRRKREKGGADVDMDRTVA